MYRVVQTNVLQRPIFDTTKRPNMDNGAFLHDFTLQLLSNAFPHLQKYRIWLMGSVIFVWLIGHRLKHLFVAYLT